MELRANNFDVMRVLLASTVIFSHSFPILRKDGAEPFYAVTHDINAGTAAVIAFFAISGFLVTNSWTNSKSVWVYVRKRACRIYPGLVICLLFCAFVVAPLGGARLHNYLEKPIYQSIYYPLIGKSLFFLPFVFPSSGLYGWLNTSIWTIRFEIACYILVAAFGLMGVLKQRFLVLAFFFGTMVMHPGDTLRLNYFGDVSGFTILLQAFLSGMVFYLFRESIPHSRKLALIAVFCLFGFVGSSHFSKAVVVCGSYLLFYIAFSKSINLHNFGRRGDFSYGIYLYGFPVQQLISSSLTITDPWLLSALSIVGTLVLAIASWNFVEKPFLVSRDKEIMVEKFASTLLLKSQAAVQ